MNWAGLLLYYLVYLKQNHIIIINSVTGVVALLFISYTVLLFKIFALRPNGVCVTRGALVEN